MNRLVSTNLEAVRLDRLPPQTRRGPVRALFLSGSILGFRRYHENLVDRTDNREDVDAVHIALRTPLPLKVIGKSAPFPTRGWDFHSLRHLWLWRWLMNRWLRGLLPAERFDLIHIMTQGNAFSLVDLRRWGYTGILATNIDGTAVQDVTDFGFSSAARAPVIRVERRIFGSADFVVCRNGWAATSLRRDYALPDDRIVVAKNSMNPPDIRIDRASLPSGRLPRLVFVGNDWGRKGGPRLLRLHQARFAERAELHVFSRRAPADHSARNVVWHGQTPHDRLLRELLPAMDIFVMPTRLDMHPWAILEAAAVGLPVVSTRFAGIPEIVRDRETGLLVDVGDWRGVEAAIDRLLSDEPLRERMGRAARDHVRRHYDPDHHFGCLIDRLVRAANERRDSERGSHPGASGRRSEVAS